MTPIRVQFSLGDFSPFLILFLKMGVSVHIEGKGSYWYDETIFLFVMGAIDKKW